jgi:hypothetical protein
MSSVAKYICMSVALLTAGCASPGLTVVANIPPPLVRPLPLKVGLRVTDEFAHQMQKEPVGSEEWRIVLGTAQAEAFRRVGGAIFREAVTLDDKSAGGAAAAAPQQVDAILQASLDSFSTLMPSAGSSYYSATIGYRFDLQDADGKELGSWIYEGYGSVPSRAGSNKTGVSEAAGRAIRDAFANMAVHLPEQEIVRKLLRTEPAVQTPAEQTK